MRLLAVGLLERGSQLCNRGGTYERALTFLLLRLRRRTRFFLHLALILSAG